MLDKISVFVINLKDRTDRKRHIQGEFRNRNEFDLTIVSACKDDIGAIGLWNTIQHILKSPINRTNEFVILCEDDHQFTTEYSQNLLLKCITKARASSADIILGGVSWYANAIQISEELFWVDTFSGLQFTVIFHKFFQTILDADFRIGEAADYKISSLTDNKFFIYPFISIQKDFGYSDVTSKNNVKGRVEKIFNRSTTKIELLKNVSAFYRKNRIVRNLKYNSRIWDNVTIPTYVINLSGKEQCKKHIEKQFKGKKEFDIKRVKAHKHKIRAVGLWLSIRQIIEISIKKEDDVIIICENIHEFTEYYSKELLMQNIMEAHEQHAEYLSGGTFGFDTAVPITPSLFWISQSLSTQFIILYKDLFKKILDEPFNDSVKPYLLLSEITSNKMVMLPFISQCKNYDCPDATPINNAYQGLVVDLFTESSRRLELMRKIQSKFNSHK